VRVRVRVRCVCVCVCVCACVRACAREVGKQQPSAPSANTKKKTHAGRTQAELENAKKKIRQAMGTVPLAAFLYSEMVLICLSLYTFCCPSRL
jgi:hypothetical protein